MPKAMEENLKHMAMKKFGSSTSKRARRYIYGTINKVEGNKHMMKEKDMAMKNTAMKMRAAA